MIRLKPRNPLSFFSGIVFNSDGFFRWLFIPKSSFDIAYQYLYLYQILDLNTRYLAANNVRGWGIFLVSPENLTNRMLQQPTCNKEASQANQGTQYSSPDHIHHSHNNWPVFDGRQIGEIVSGVGDQAE